MGIETVLLAAGAGLSLIGQGVQAHQQYQTSMSNAAQAEADAKYVEAQTEKAVGRYQEQGEAFKSRQRAIVGASGAGKESLSPLMIMEETTRKMEEDIAEMRTEGSHVAGSFRRQAGQYGQQAISGAVSNIFGMGSTFATSLGKMKFKPSIAGNNPYASKKIHSMYGLSFPG